MANKTVHNNTHKGNNAVLLEIQDQLARMKNEADYLHDSLVSMFQGRLGLSESAQDGLCLAMLRHTYEIEKVITDLDEIKQQQPAQ